MAGNDKEASLLIRIKQAGAEVLDKIGSGIASVGKIATAVFGAVSAVVVKSISEFGQTEKAVNSLNQAMVQQGIYSKELAESYKKMAEAQSEKSTYDDAEILSAQAVMQQYLGQIHISKELLQATTDLAAAKKMDLASAAEMVAKSIGTGTNALARQGVQLSETTDKSRKMSEVIEKLNRNFGGQAEAATRGMGSIVMMEKAINDLFKALGEMLQPVVVMVTTSIREMADEIRGDSNAMASFREVIKYTAEAGLILYQTFASIAQILGGTLGTAFAALSQAIDGNWRQAWETVKSGAADMTDDLVDRWAKAGEQMEKMDKAFSDTKQANLRTDEEMTAQSEANKAAIKKEKADEEIANRIQQRDLLDQMDADDLEKLITLEGLRADAEFMGQLKRLEQSKHFYMSKKQLAEIDLEQQKLIQNKLLDWEQMTTAKRLQVMQTIGNEAQQLGDNLVKLTGGNNKELLALQKALGVAMIIINAEIAKHRALSELGPIFGGIAAGVITASEAVSIALVGGLQLAEGGVVKARPGGTVATIGEGGRDEAVIPLEDGKVPGMGGNITINVYGGLLGDDASAYELARAVDRQLKRLEESGDRIS